MNKIKVHTDLRAQFSRVANQGRRPTCLAFASTSAHEYLHQCDDPLCVEWLYYHAVAHAGDAMNAGSTLPATQHVLSHEGQPHESHWPYTSVDPKVWSPPAPTPKVLFHAKSLDVASAHEHITDALNAGGPSVVAMNIGSAFQKWAHASGEAVIADETEHPSQGAGHALLVVGHGDYETIPLLLLRNSWGPRWGDDGYAWISAHHVSNRWMGGFRLEEI